MLCYAIGMVAYSLHAATPVMSTDFYHDGDLIGKKAEFGLSDTGLTNQTATTRWWASDAQANYSVIRDYGNSEKRYDGFGETVNPQPSYMMAGFDNFGYLPFSTAVALYRTINVVDESGASKSLTYSNGFDIYFDQLVQFTRREERADQSPAAFLPSEAKFACWLPSDVDRLAITAGFLSWAGAESATNCTVIATNYLTTANVTTGKWYRLTVRTIANARTDGGTVPKVPAAAVYLDGVRVGCDESYAIGDDLGATDDFFQGSPHYLARGLFPSLTVSSGLSTTGVRGLAVVGKGKLDEIGVVNKSNPLLPEGEITEVELQVAIDTNKLAGVSVQVTAKDADDPYNTVETTGQTITSVNVQPGDKIKIAVTAGEGATANSQVTFYGNLTAIKSTDRTQRRYSFTMASSFAIADPVGVRVDAGLANFEVAGKTYESVSEALDAAWGKDGDGPRELALNRDLQLNRSVASDNGQMHVLPVHSLTFDLRGHALRGDNYNLEAAIYTQGRLTIVDSVGGGSISAPGKVIEVASTNTALEVNYDNAALTMGDKDVNGDFTVTGRVVCTKGELTLKGGTYFTPTDLLPRTDFYLERYVAAERFYSSNDLVRCSTPGALWTVVYDGRFRVAFEVPHGTPSPVYTNVNTAAGAYVVAPAIAGNEGYTVTNWYVKGVSPQLDWNLASDAVTNDMTLVGQQRLDSFTITYSKAAEQPAWPTEYTVESAYRELPEPAKIPNYNFVGWRDGNSGHAVAAIGAGARWTDADAPVSGDLALVAEWQPDALRWTNLGAYTSESNGYYNGVWRFTVPAGGDLAAGAEVTIDEIAFAVVNPLTLPKSAPYLAVTPNGASTPVYSAERPVGYDATSGEYAAATNTLANGRTALVYRFTDLTVRVGADNEVQFSSVNSGAVSPVEGFLRLAVKPNADDAVFGNCTAPEEYRIYCPVYEVSGHVKGEVE